MNRCAQCAQGVKRDTSLFQEGFEEIIKKNLAKGLLSEVCLLCICIIIVIPNPDGWFCFFMSVIIAKCVLMTDCSRNYHRRGFAYFARCLYVCLWMYKMWTWNRCEVESKLRQSVNMDIVRASGEGAVLVWSHRKVVTSIGAINKNTTIRL